MNLGKKITKGLSLMWILGLCIYSTLIIGTLAHELTHKSYAIESKAIIVNFDTSGEHYGSTFKHSHEWVYFNGYIVETMMILLTLMSVVIILK